MVGIVTPRRRLAEVGGVNEDLCSIPFLYVYTYIHIYIYILGSIAGMQLDREIYIYIYFFFTRLGMCIIITSQFSSNENLLFRFSSCAGRRDVVICHPSSLPPPLAPGARYQ